MKKMANERGEEGEREMDERRGEERRRGKELKSEC